MTNLAVSVAICLSACAQSKAHIVDEGSLQANPPGDLSIDYCLESTTDFCGRLVQDAHESLIALAHQSDHFSVASSGGDARIALIAAAEIRAAGVNIHLERICASGCVEVIAPAARNIRLVMRPVLAVHGNPQLKRLIEQRGGVSAPRCQRAYRYLFDRYLGDRISSDMLDMQFDRLGVTEIVVRPRADGACPDLEYQTEADYILLTSDELEYYYGVPVEGQSAIDGDADIQGIVDRWFDRGLRVWARDAIYVSGDTDASKIDQEEGGSP